MHPQPTIMNNLRELSQDILTGMSTERAMKAYFRSRPLLLLDSESTYESKELTRLVTNFHAGNLSSQERRYLRHILRARLDLHRRVNRYPKILDMNYLPPIEEWWEESLALMGLLFTREEFQNVYFLVIESGLLNIPPDEAGQNTLYYLKPAQYIAAAFCVAGYELSDVEFAIEKMWGLYNPRAVYVRSHKCRFGERLGWKSVVSKELDHDEFQDVKSNKNSLKKWLRGLKRFGDLVPKGLGSAVVV
jgi:hypothetical protein